MRWLLAGLLFALAVSLAIGTAALRASNTCQRHQVEQAYREVGGRIVELRRLSVRRLEVASTEQLALRHWRVLRAEFDRATESRQ
jgi:hypothetical protein